MGELKKLYVLTDGEGNFRGDIFSAFVNRANAEAELRKHAGQIQLFQEVDLNVQPDAAPTEDGPFQDVSPPEENNEDSEDVRDDDDDSPDEPASGGEDGDDEDDEDDEQDAQEEADAPAPVDSFWNEPK
jgi:hypothetical protein